MTQDEQIEIPLSKNKMFKTLLGALVFVGIGIWFLINPNFGNPTLISIIGLASILFFGLGGVIILRKFSDKNPGLIISRQGITDNSSGVSAGLITWKDIQEIKISKIMSEKFIILVVRNPQYYLDKVTNPLKRNTIKINCKIYGSPISISANALQTNFNELHTILVKKMNDYKS